MKRPPIEGLPKERPLCGYCGKKIAPLVFDERVRELGEPRPAKVYEAGDADDMVRPVQYRFVSRRFAHWKAYGADGALFCTLRCCEKFAAACYLAGMRMSKPKG